MHSLHSSFSFSYFTASLILSAYFAKKCPLPCHLATKPSPPMVTSLYDRITRPPNLIHRASIRLNFMRSPRGDVEQFIVSVPVSLRIPLYFSFRLFSWTCTVRLRLLLRWNLYEATPNHFLSVVIQGQVTIGKSFINNASVNLLLRQIVNEFCLRTPNRDDLHLSY